MSEQAGRDAVPGFGEKVRELREAKGWSQPQLAERAGTHFTTISKIEKGERSASLQLALKIADALGVPVTKLVPADWKDRGESGGTTKPVTAPAPDAPPARAGRKPKGKPKK